MQHDADSDFTPVVQNYSALSNTGKWNCGKHIAKMVFDGVGVEETALRFKTIRRVVLKYCLRHGVDRKRILGPWTGLKDYDL